MIATLPNSNSLGVLQLFIKEGGSRYLKEGLPAMLGYFGYTGNEGYSALKMAREAEQRGVSLSYTVERDYMGFKAQFIKSELPFVMQVFKTIQNVEYEEYKYKDIMIKSESETWGAFSTQNVFIKEYLHLLSFRGQGLGKSIYPASAPTLSDIVESSKVLKNAKLFGIGFEKSELSQFDISLTKSSVSATKNVFIGGETSIQKPFANTVAIAVPISSPANALALKRSLGDSTSFVKYGHSQSVLGQLIPANSSIYSSVCSHEHSPSLFQFTITSTSPDGFKKCYTAIKESLTKVKSTLEPLKEENFQSQLSQLINNDLSVTTTNGNAIDAAKEALSHLQTKKSVVYVGNCNAIPPFE